MKLERYAVVLRGDTHLFCLLSCNANRSWNAMQLFVLNSRGGRHLMFWFCHIGVPVEAGTLSSCLCPGETSIFAAILKTQSKLECCAVACVEKRQAFDLFAIRNSSRSWNAMQLFVLRGDKHLMCLCR